jgi:hypothetical protein
LTRNAKDIPRGKYVPIANGFTATTAPKKERGTHSERWTLVDQPSLRTLRHHVHPVPPCPDDFVQEA